MYTLSNMPSTTSVVSTYTAFAASALLARSVITEIQSMTAQLIPATIRQTLISKLGFLFGNSSSDMTLIIDERINGLSLNEVYEASHLYLQGKISPSNTKLKVTKSQGEKDLTITVNKGEEIIDLYQGIRLKWVLICNESKKSTNVEYDDFGNPSEEEVVTKSFELSFLKKDKEVIIGSYLPYIMEFAKSWKEANRVVGIVSLGGGYYTPMKLNHPSTFDTLAMDPTIKKAIKGDLDRFLKRNEYYRKVGKAWKRGYLLYGPPGTGKSSLIAAMANYLNFDIYDLDLKSIKGDMNLRNLLVSTKNRSIVVIEDIDCSVEMQNRSTGTRVRPEPKHDVTGITLSGLLNFIDGLWSCCGDERIIVFTTNYKDKLDPALLRPGRMDMHINMSYLAPSGFRVLALNYLDISTHPLFTQIDDLLAELEVTPATVAEQLMRSDNNPDEALESLLQFLRSKKSEACKNDPQGGGGESDESKSDIQGTIKCDPNGKGGKRRNRISRVKKKHAVLWR